MRQSKFTETQSVSNLKEAVAGRPVNEIWRQYGISSATYYKWKAKCGGLEASDVKGLRELEHENGRLKRMYADETGHVLSVPHRLGSTGCPGHRGLHDPASGQKSLGLLEVL